MLSGFCFCNILTFFIIKVVTMKTYITFLASLHGDQSLISKPLAIYWSLQQKDFKILANCLHPPLTKSEVVELRSSPERVSKCCFMILRCDDLMLSKCRLYSNGYIIRYCRQWACEFLYHPALSCKFSTFFVTISWHPCIQGRELFIIIAFRPTQALNHCISTTTSQPISHCVFNKPPTLSLTQDINLLCTFYQHFAKCTSLSDVYTGTRVPPRHSPQKAIDKKSIVYHTTFHRYEGSKLSLLVLC